MAAIDPLRTNEFIGVYENQLQAIDEIFIELIILMDQLAFGDGNSTEAQEDFEFLKRDLIAEIRTLHYKMKASGVMLHLDQDPISNIEFIFLSLVAFFGLPYLYMLNRLDHKFLNSFLNQKTYSRWQLKLKSLFRRKKYRKIQETTEFVNQYDQIIRELHDNLIKQSPENLELFIKFYYKFLAFFNKDWAEESLERLRSIDFHQDDLSYHAQEIVNSLVNSISQEH